VRGGAAGRGAGVAAPDWVRTGVSLISRRTARQQHAIERGARSLNGNQGVGWERRVTVFRVGLPDLPVGDYNARHVRLASLRIVRWRGGLRVRVCPMCRWLWFGLALLMIAPAVQGADPPERARQLEYDPATGTWVQSEPPVPGTATGDLQLVRQALAREKHRRAYRAVRKWLKTYGPDESLYPEALLLRAEIEIARGDYYKAHQHLQEFLGEFDGTAWAEQAAYFQFVIAENFAIAGKRRKWLGMRILKATDTGVDILDEISNSHPESILAQQAIMTKADHYYDRGEFLLAEMEYARLVEEYPRSQCYRKAMRRSAESALASFGGVDFDDAPLIEAEDRFGHYLALYPGSAEQEGIGLILQQIHTLRAAKELSIGQYYERTGHPRSAVFYYQSTCANWPDSIAAAQARPHLARLTGEQTPPQTPAEPSATESPS